MSQNSLNPIKAFISETEDRINSNGQNKTLQDAAARFMDASLSSQYSYNFTWLGRPIIQYPQDIVAMQELIWRIQPDLIIETGIAHGGSLILYASILELIGKGHVLGIDIDIREHNRQEIVNHKVSNRITMLQGSSIDKEIVKKVEDFAASYKTVMVILDSNHTHEHVLEELRAYAPLVTKGSYCVVFDTIVEDLDAATATARPWKKGNNPKTALFAYLKENDNFSIDKSWDNKILISVAPDGFLVRNK